MKIIIEEYGSVVIDAVVAVLIIGLLFVFPIGGGRGIVGAIGANFSIGGDVSTNLSEADKVAQNNRASYTLDQKEDCLTVGAATPLSAVASSTDSTAVFSVAWAKDNNGNDAIENGALTYNRKTHSVTANKRGIYSMEIRASGKQLMRQTFVVTAK